MTGESRVERYLAHLDLLSGGVEPTFHPVREDGDEHFPITVICYRDLPEPGDILGFTYGLSLAGNPAWTHGRPELSICMRSEHLGWPLSVGYLAASLRHDCPFSYGDTIDFGEHMAPGESALDGFVVFAPLALEPEDAHVDVGDDLPIHVAGMYPVHASERAFISEHGLEAFWRLDWDPADPTRAAAV